MKEKQDKYFPERPYICFASEFTGLEGNQDDGCDDNNSPVDGPFCMIICMTKDSSRHLQRAHYLQSDIGFKRIVGFKEFELGGLDDDSRTS